jgi:hypothetical protein
MEGWAFRGRGSDATKFMRSAYALFENEVRRGGFDQRSGPGGFRPWKYSSEQNLMGQINTAPATNNFILDR